MLQQPPASLTWAIVALAGASLLLLIGLGGHWLHGRPILPFSPRRVVPWTALDMFIVLVLYFGLQAACGGLAYLLLSPEKVVVVAAPAGIEVAPEAKLEVIDLVPLLGSLTVANFLILAGSIKFLRWRTGATLADMGFDSSHLLQDAGLGAMAFLAALLPVYAIQAVLTQFLPSQHPVVSLLSEDSQAAQLLLVAVSAVIVAPLVEEFLFRGLLQGWLEAVDAYWQRQVPSAPVAIVDLPNSHPLETPVPTVDAVPNENPYRSPPTVAATPARESLVDKAAAPPRKWTIIVSSLAFAMVHWGHGPDPIPLFVLALILGYVYRQTHRLWPCIVLHMALNGLSLSVLWITLKYGHMPVG